MHFNKEQMQYLKSRYSSLKIMSDQNSKPIKPEQFDFFNNNGQIPLEISSGKNSMVPEA